MTDRSTASRLLREARARSGLSQRDLAEKAGTSQSVIGRVEAGLSSPSVETLERLIDAAGLEMRFELSAKSVRDPAVEAYKPGIDRTLLIENLRKSPDERVKALVEMQTFHEEVRRAMREAHEGRHIPSRHVPGKLAP